MKATDILWSLISTRDEIEAERKQRDANLEKLDTLYDKAKDLLRTLPLGTVLEAYGTGIRLTLAGELEVFKVINAYSLNSPKPAAEAVAIHEPCDSENCQLPACRDERDRIEALGASTLDPSDHPKADPLPSERTLAHA